MSGEDVDEKREQLCLFVAASRKRLQAILKRFDWSERGVMEASDHNQQDKNGATASEVLPLPTSCSKDPAYSMQLDDSTIQAIVGTGEARRLLLPAASFDDLQAGFDARERLLIYEHVLQHTKKHPQFQDNAAFAEVVGETRRERKKQRRHRKSKPTLNEELHQLVGLQMQALERQWQQEHDGRLQKQDGRHNEQTQHRAQAERLKGRHNETVERFVEHRGRHTEQTQHRERLKEHKDRGQRHVHRVWRHEHRDWHKRHGGSRQRSRSRSRNRERGQERQRHEDRRREEREPREQHHKKHRSHTSRH